MPHGGSAHIWYARPSAGRQDQAALLALLSEEELSRHARLPEPLRASYVTAHALLRLAVVEHPGGPGGIALRDVPLGRNAMGQPRVDGAPQLHVSLSHTAGGVLAACSAGGPIGVDIERVRPLAGRDALAGRVLGPVGLARWRTTPGECREIALLKCWTCKEAVLKAAGTGLMGGLARVRPGPGPGSWLAPDTRGREYGVRPWRTAALPVDPSHVAAVAVAAPDGSDEPFLECEGHGERAVRGIEFGQQVGDVPFGAVFRDADTSGDLLVAEALRQERENLLLAGGE